MSSLSSSPSNQITSRIAQARIETQDALKKALAYSYNLQKPAQIDFYTAHLTYLDALATGQPCEAPKANTTEWDTLRVVAAAREARS